VELTEELAEAAEVGYSARGTRGPMLVQARRSLIGRAARAAEADLVHLSEALGTPLFRGAPRVTTCYDLIPLRYPQEYLYGSLGHAIRFGRDLVRYRTPDRVVAISQKTADELVELLHVPRERIDVVLLGIDQRLWREEISEAEQRRRLGELGVADRCYVFYLGYSDFRKNVAGMMSALRHARNELDVELVWAGQLPQDELQSVQREARIAGVERFVRLLGFVSDSHLASLFRGAVAHLFLSRLEGFGLSVTEAMVAGCPVIVARGSGCDELASDAAIVVDPNDFLAAGNAIVQLSRDRAERERRISAGMERGAHFDLDRMARGYVETYRRALHGL
jgi:glycosyltransferase involved in cell wall biosynthesis